MEHRKGVLPLQVLLEVVVVEGDVVEAQPVQDIPGGLIAQQGGVALHIGVQALLLDEVGGDTLDLGGGTAVEGGLGDGLGHHGGEPLHKSGVHLGKLVQVLQRPLFTALEHGGAGGVHHLVDVLVNLGALDARQVIAHAHVEYKAAVAAQLQLPGEELAGKPGFDILLKGLGHSELGGPLAVIALIPGGDAGLVHALGQLLAVHDLHRFQLKEPGAGHIGGDDILRQLGVGTGGGPQGDLHLFPEHGPLGPVDRPFGDAEHGAMTVVLR